MEAAESPKCATIPWSLHEYFLATICIRFPMDATWASFAILEEPSWCQSSKTGQSSVGRVYV